MNFTTKLNKSHVGPVVVNLRCPACSNRGAFHGFPNVNDLAWQQADDTGGDDQKAYTAGIRRCPSPGCHAPVFVILKSGQLYKSYPPEVIDFDATDIPEAIRASVKEAIKCHSDECYRAAAIMVRRTLEEICADRGAVGKDLNARIKELKQHVIIPEELLDAANELRILGNDAAHIEAKVYDEIGREEAEVAIELAKELLKAVYQYSSLLQKLRAFKNK